MPFADLREYVSKLEQAGEIARVRKEVDPKFEVGAITDFISARESMKRVSSKASPRRYRFITSSSPGTLRSSACIAARRGSGIFHCYIQIDERLKRPGMVNNILASSVGVKGSRVKHVFVFDDDVDITSPEEVEWAIATRVQADKDIFIIPNTVGLRLDPAATAEGVTAKLFVHATKSKDFRSEGLALSPDEVWQQVRKNWDSYFVE